MNYIDLHHTNWLGSNLVFYNELTGISSNVFSEVLVGSELKIDREELRNFLKYGFSFYGKTPIKGVRYTLPNTILRKFANGCIQEVPQDDPMEKLVGKKSSEQSVHEKIGQWMSSFHTKNSSKSIILPLSGGLDSRLLAVYCKDHSNVNSFTYGISRRQSQSSEVILAKQVAAACNIKWEQITLGKFHNYLDINNNIYGLSTHAHSMYHFEFYKGILDYLGNSNAKTVLSGIYGDVWAGSWKFPEINHPKDVRKLAVTHGMVGSRSQFFDPDYVSESEETYFRLNAEKLKDPVFRVVEAARLKVVLNRHLIATPNYFGLHVDSPFLEIDIASEMLNLDPKRRNQRKWQSEFLDGKLPELSKRNPKFKIHNVSDLQATIQVPVPQLLLTSESPVELKLLNVGKINKRIKVGKILYILILFFSVPFFSRIKPQYKWLNFRENYANYMTAFPIFIQFGRVKS